MVMTMPGGEMRLGESTGVENPQRDTVRTRRGSPEGRGTSMGKGRVQEIDEVKRKKTDM